MKRRRTIPATLRTSARTFLFALALGLAATTAAAQCNFDVDGNGVQEAATDGVLLLRYLHGLRGDALIERAVAVSPPPTRSTAQAIEQYLAIGDFDIDGDGKAAAATDGLLVFRHLDGLRGSALTGGIGLDGMTFSESDVEARIAQVRARDNASAACRLALIGISKLAFGPQTGTAFHVAAGSVRELAVTFETTAASAAPTVTFTVQSGGAFASVETAGGLWGLNLDATSLAAGATGNFVLRVSNGATGQVVDVTSTLTALAPSHQATALVGSGGGALPTGSGTSVVFGANNLPAPLDVRLVETVAPDGNALLQIEFDPAASSSNMTIMLPDPNDDQLALQTLSGSSPKAFSPSQLVMPYKDNDDSLGFRWRVFKGYVLGGKDVKHRGHRIPQMTPLFVTDAGRFVLAPPSTRFVVQSDKQTYAELHSVMPPPSAAVDVGEYRPVLFINGFFPAGLLGGGKDTWAQFPTLMRDSANLFGKKFIPFEFRWQTDAHFADAAGDLAQAIRYIKVLTGQNVHVVAHSFGGMLVRTLLQGQARGLPPGSTVAAEARAAISSVLSLGSPYSGIADEVTTVDGVTLPVGGDSGFLGFCAQVSCHVMGRAGIITSPALRRVLGVGDPGQLPASLTATAGLATGSGGLPNVNITAGIGLTINRSGATRYDAGDYLISYQGQRFLASDSTALNAPSPPPSGLCQVAGAAGGIEPLRKAALLGQATVTEVVLGIKRDVRPGDARLQGDTNDFLRFNGYLHSGRSAFANAFDGDKDGESGRYWGVEAAPARDCRSGGTCLHAGFQLFKQYLAAAAEPDPKIYSVVAQSATHTAGTKATFLVDAYLPPALANQSIFLLVRLNDGTAATQVDLMPGRHVYTIEVAANLWYSERDTGGVLRTLKAEIPRPIPLPAIECGVFVQGLPPLPTVMPSYSSSPIVCKNNTLGFNWCEQTLGYGARLAQHPTASGSPEYRFFVDYSGAGSKCTGTFNLATWWPPTGITYAVQNVNQTDWYPQRLEMANYLVATDLHRDATVSPQNPQTFVTDPQISCTAKFKLEWRESARTSQVGETVVPGSVQFPGIPH